jgi:serine phosphatase RsbU (regulator of sigma subunit)
MNDIENNNECVCNIPISGRLKKLIEANHVLADYESLEDLFPRLLELARDVTGAEASSILMYNSKLKLLEFASVQDEILDDKLGNLLKNAVKLKLGEGIAGWVAQHKRSIIVKDASKDHRFFNKADRMTGFTTRTLLCVPMVHHEKLLGVIEVLNAKDKPYFDNEDLEILESFADLASVAIARARLLETRLNQERFKAQMEAASKIQALFWPTLPEAVEGSSVWAVSIPALFVGGDLFDVIEMQDGSWLVYVADVSDKGLPAAMIMAVLSIMIRNEAGPQVEVDRLLGKINNALYELTAEEGFFATICLGKYWPATGKMQYSLAGHYPPLWIGNNELKPTPELKAISLGVLPGVRYTRREITLEPGESLLFITDGVIETENQHQQFFGHKRVAAKIESGFGPPWGAALLEEINQWKGDADASDDLTMLEIWRQ